MADTTLPSFDLARMQRFVVEANMIHEQLKEETDRGAGLVGVAFLDDLLARLLKSRMLDDKATEALFGGSNALASFSARIDTAYSLGWIGPETHRELHLMRKIRNEFAHVHTPVTFSSDAVQNRCRELQIPKAILPARLPRARDQFLVFRRDARSSARVLSPGLPCAGTGMGPTCRTI